MAFDPKELMAKFSVLIAVAGIAIFMLLVLVFLFRIAFQTILG
ncbi:hypothetical protein ACFLQ2_05720 [archaeon]